jgi:tRNA1(Val) A37 N6-methylase TrmN6
MTSPLPGTTLDLLTGTFRIFQYKDGHRFSTDDLLTAWWGVTHAPTATTVLDLGSGIGSVGMTAAWNLKSARIVTIEAQAISTALARESAKLNGLTDRYEIREGDFRDPDGIGANEYFDLVLGSPPYFPLDSGIHGNHSQKIAARFEVRGDISDYARIAAAHLAPSGVFACIFPVDPRHQEARVLAAAANAGLSISDRRDVILKEGAAPLLGLFVMRLAPGSTRVQPPLVIRKKDGTVSEEYDTIKKSIGFPL